jgi:chromosome segregation ATPase
MAQSTHPRTEQDKLVDDILDMRDEFVRTSGEYKRSLNQLLTFYERDIKQYEEKLSKLKELYSEGLVASRDVDAGQKTLDDARAKLEDTKKQIQDTDQTLSQALAEPPADTAKKLMAQKKKLERTPTGRVYYVRFVIVGEFEIYDYSGGIKGKVLKHKGQIKVDSRKPQTTSL